MKKAVCLGFFAAVLCAFTGLGSQKTHAPVWIAFNDTENVDVVGVRFNLPNGDCETLTGLDIGFLGGAVNMYGFQLNIIQNKVVDKMAGLQVGLLNEAGNAFGIQAGVFWNENLSSTGLMAGLVNIADHHDGIQVGLINRCESLYGYQIGLVNVIRSSPVPFCPGINLQF